ncbi:hypothetical protein ACFUCQ_23605 [Streptomyces sp. NPDC057197]|uniref:hypothetical protein n=1 Tax=Streptomyces sp. NPDC057197 TaxID=3346045 RepID=UPI00363DD178
MSGYGMRNGEAAAVNLRGIVADDVYRVTEQVNQTTGHYARLKHRKNGEYRDVSLPARVKDTIEWYADKHGTVDGYLLRHPRIRPGRSRTTTSATNGSGSRRPAKSTSLSAW